MNCPPPNCEYQSVDTKLVNQYLWIASPDTPYQFHLSSQIISDSSNEPNSSLYLSFIPRNNNYNLPVIQPLLFYYSNVYELILVPTVNGTNLPPFPIGWPNYKLVTKYNSVSKTFQIPFWIDQNSNGSILSLIDKWAFIKNGTDAHSIHPCSNGLITCGGGTEQKSYLCPDTKFSWQRNISSGIVEISGSINRFFIAAYPATVFPGNASQFESMIRQSRWTYNIIKIMNSLSGRDTFYKTFINSKTIDHFQKKEKKKKKEKQNNFFFLNFIFFDVNDKIKCPKGQKLFATIKFVFLNYFPFPNLNRFLYLEFFFFSYLNLKSAEYYQIVV